MAGKTPAKTTKKKATPKSVKKASTAKAVRAKPAAATKPAVAAKPAVAVKAVGTKKPAVRALKLPPVVLIASGDLRDSANLVCWPAQQAMEAALAEAVKACGRELVRAHGVKETPAGPHGFISSQREGMEVFRSIDPDAPIIVAEAVWQYSHHVLAGLEHHRGPVLTVANWSGQWPGLVGLLNLNASLAKAGVRYSSLWGEDFADATFRARLAKWLRSGEVKLDTSHVRPLAKLKVSEEDRATGRRLATELLRDRAILGVFDEGCMGMYNAIVPDRLLHRCGVYKERLSQSALYFASTQVSDQDAAEVYGWLTRAGMKFNFGENPESDLTESQVVTQCRMYVAACRLADEFGCDAIGIQYQQGLKDLLPASDLVEGMLNNADRPPVKSLRTGKVIAEGRPLPHFNEVDECAGLDHLMTLRTHEALRQPVESTLHDLRWSDRDQSGTVAGEVWVLLISGAAPPAHFVGGWTGASGERQPPMYFRLGGSTLKGVSRPGHIVWSRVWVDGGAGGSSRARGEERLCMDLGVARVVELPEAETQRRWRATTPQWPIMHAVFDGITRDQMMARHKSNHIQVAYANSAEEAKRAMGVKAYFAEGLGMEVAVCGMRSEATTFR